MAGIVDIHAHFVSPDLIAEVGRKGDQFGMKLDATDAGKRLVFSNGSLSRFFFDQLTDLSLRLPLLKTQGVTQQYISGWTDIAADFLPAKEGARWARLQNETLADGARQYPELFRAMGTLPMGDVSLAIEELNHIVRNLGMSSVQIVTNVNGTDLDHAEFRPLWKALRDLDVFVMLHPPLVPIGGERIGQYFLNNLIGFPADTALAGARLMFSGLMSDLPGLKCCLVHAGGFLPYQIGRLQRGYDANPVCRANLKMSPVEMLNSFYFDTLTHGDAALAFLLDVIDNDRIMYGSDYPFEMYDVVGPERISRLPGRSHVSIDAILRGNAERALQRLKQPA